MKIEELIPIVYQGERVLTGKQIAELYNVSDKRIKDNFHTLRKHFKEGIHFHKVEGEELHALKEQVNEEVVKRLMRVEQTEISYLQNVIKSPLATYTRSAILYTAKGCVRHCKSLQSPEAWKVFGELETAYFGQETASPVQQSLPLPVEPVVAVEAKACVYVLGLTNSSTKIGITKDILERARIIEKQSGATVERIYNSALMSKDVALAVEKTLHDKFDAHRLEGEFFSVPFEVACRALVLALSDLPADPKALPDPTLADKIFAYAEKISDASTRDKILTHAVNLLVGHERF